jgi:hypothetical protein
VNPGEFQEPAVPSRTVTDPESRFSLVAGEGDGAMLGLAAGDSAGGLWELGYTAITEQATVIAYELIEHGGLEVDSLVGAMRGGAGVPDGEPSAEGLAGWGGRGHTGPGQGALSRRGAPRGAGRRRLPS